MKVKENASLTFVTMINRTLSLVQVLDLTQGTPLNSMEKNMV